MSNEKTPVREQLPDVRNKNFNEVCLGYDLEQAKLEADRCLNCKNHPCMEGCPVNVKIPEFITKIKEGDIDGAYGKILETNSLPAVCGRVCPQESQCEKHCVRGIKGQPVAIGRLERFTADNRTAVNVKKMDRCGKKVAVVGSGPSGLACAGDLNKYGYDVTVFEALHKAGGVLSYGIPEFRLPKAIVQREVDNLAAAGVNVETDVVIGKSITVDELLSEEYGFSAVYIASGAGLPMFMGIEGEGLNGVFSANEYLTRINLMKAYEDAYDTPIFKAKTVVVVGGGNVAMDAARCAKRMGADVYIVYRRSEKEMPARAEEVHHAKEEGINFKVLCNPTKIVGNEKGWVTGIECVEMALGEPDVSGRRSVTPIEGSDFSIQADCVIMALGTSPNPLIKNTTAGLETNKKGCIIAEENGQTSKEFVYAGGDAVSGAATVILAMGAGKRAAKAIHEQLSE